MSKRHVASGEDTVLNMTPMIDVCFQLVVFFMLTMKFKSIDKRFETQLPNVGQSSRPHDLPALQEITVKLFRKDVESKDVNAHFTRVRVGEMTTVDMPKGPWPKDSAGEDARRKVEDGLYQQVAEAIALAWAKQDRAPQVTGEIKTPHPTGALVPHGDVMRVLDSFLAAGVAVVNFEGAPAPLATSAGGGWDFEHR